MRNIKMTIWIKNEPDSDKEPDSPPVYVPLPEPPQQERDQLFALDSEDETKEQQEPSLNEEEQQGQPPAMEQEGTTETEQVTQSEQPQPHQPTLGETYYNQAYLNTFERHYFEKKASRLIKQKQQEVIHLCEQMKLKCNH